MSRTDYLDAPVCVPAERRKWPPAIKLILAFMIGVVVLSPAILGLYWELILPW